MKNLKFVLALLALATGSCNQAPKKPATDQFAGLLENAKAVFSPLQEEAINPDNPVTKEKVFLGQTLYFDKRLSKDETVSCNSCHDLQNYGVDNEPTDQEVLEIVTFLKTLTGTVPAELAKEPEMPR